MWILLIIAFGGSFDGGVAIHESRIKFSQKKDCETAANLLMTHSGPHGVNAFCIEEKNGGLQ